MRIQYHSRTDKNGRRLIWNVHKLLGAAKNLPVIDYPLSKISEIDENYWFDENSPPPSARNVAIHAKLINECSLDYPILLCPEGRVMDGMHRICKALILRHTTIKARQFKTEPMPDYIDVKIETLPHDDPVEL